MYFEVDENFWYPLMTLSIAFKKSSSVTALRRARIANMPASVHTLRISAPVVLGHSRASSSKRMPRSHVIGREWILKISVRPSRSGSPNSTLRSRRPGRFSAGSSVSGRFVAISTLMLPRASNPSSWFTSSSMVFCTSVSPLSPSPSKRVPPMLSTSSKKI